MFPIYFPFTVYYVLAYRLADPKSPTKLPKYEGTEFETRVSFQEIIYSALNIEIALIVIRAITLHTKYVGT